MTLLRAAGLLLTLVLAACGSNPTPEPPTGPGTPAGSAPAALVRARLARGDLTQWLAQSYLGTEPGVQRFEAISATPSGPSVVAVRQGELATVFTALGPAADFATTLPMLTQILDSFRFAPAAAGNAPAPPETR